MDKNKQPGISFDGIILVAEEFWRDFDVPEDGDLDFSIEAANSKIDENYNVELETNLRIIKDDEEKLKLQSKFVGLFSTIDGEENMDIDEYIENNAPALMFPYVREHISAITTKSGINPIFLPPINFVTLLKNK
ncbi:MAG TPA: protein-export chaperone SecB [Tissierellales bacterium]|nr:protein-export chaperone SecB [Tissierellales bacterium]